MKRRRHRPLRSAEANRARNRAASFGLAPERLACPTPHKHAYQGRKEAKAGLRRMATAGLHGAKGLRLHVYKCRCLRFHIGAANPRLHRDEHNPLPETA